ncbi:MAG: DUF4091 domain-containing protein [Clostridia bacterium]|nr:DUF4091 domain-containing protein [Clostridia bacterium]
MLKVKPLSPLVKVFSDEEPKAKTFERLSIFRNEKASLQIALTSDCDSKVSVEIKSPFAQALKPFVVEEIYSAMPVAKTQDDYTLRKDAGKFPELLRPLEGQLSLTAGKWTSLWLSIDPNPELPAGEQKVQVNFNSGAEQSQAEFIIDVIDCELPKQSLLYTNWFHTDCLATYYKAEVFSDRYWSIVETYLKTAREYGMNVVLTPIFTPPLDTKKGGERLTVQLIGVSVDEGKYSFDFSNLDKWIDMCHRVGIEYFEMAHFFTQWGAKKCPKIVANVEGQVKKIFGWNTRGAGRKYKAFLTALAPRLKEYLIQKGVADKVFFHVSDEPFAGVIRQYRKASEIVKQLFGDFKIIDALSDYKFYQKGLVELPIPANDHIGAFIGNVKELWTYYCCAQVDRVANRFFSMPSQRNRVLGCQMYKYDVKGFLHWGFNFWYKRLSVGEVDPYQETDAGGFFPSGDSFVVYPGKDEKPLISLRLRVFYDGLQDMRALQLAESLIGREKTLELLEQGADKPITFADYPHSDEWQLQMRERINDAIRQELKKK